MMSICIPVSSHSSILLRFLFQLSPISMIQTQPIPMDSMLALGKTELQPYCIKLEAKRTGRH
jgi:hypothetical protein